MMSSFRIVQYLVQVEINLSHSTFTTLIAATIAAVYMTQVLGEPVVALSLVRGNREALNHFYESSHFRFPDR